VEKAMGKLLRGLYCIIFISFSTIALGDDNKLELDKIIHYFYKEDHGKKKISINRGDNLPKINISSNSNKRGPKLEITIKKSDNDTSLLQKAYKAYTLGQVEAAEHLYKNALEMDKSNIQAELGLAIMYQNENMLYEAEKLYKKVLHKDPANVEALNNYLAILAKTEPKAILTEFRRLEAAAPYQSFIPAQIAMIYASLGEYQKAIRAFDRALSLDPNNNSYKLNLAILLANTGHKEQAANLFNQLLIKAGLGEKMPESTEKIAQRLYQL